jgi:hypothetical protein
MLIIFWSQNRSRTESSIDRGPPDRNKEFTAPPNDWFNISVTIPKFGLARFAPSNGEGLAKFG